MLEDSGWYTCEICGQGQLSETAARTHMYTAHVYDEVACMFCDLKGVTAEEMTLHINSVHCSDHKCDDDFGRNGSQGHLNSVPDDAKKQSTNQIQATRSPVESGLMSMHHNRETFVDLVDSVDVTDRTGNWYSSNRSFPSNCNAEKSSYQSCSASLSQKLPKIALANHIDQTSRIDQGGRYVEYSCLSAFILGVLALLTIIVDGVHRR